MKKLLSLLISTLFILTIPLNAYAFGDTPLIKAVKSNSIKEVRSLIEQGANVDERDSYNHTPLYWATENIDIARLLIEKGADVNAKGDGGYTSLHVVKDSNVARLLIEKGADVNAKNKDGETPLDTAERMGHTEVIAVLKGNNANTSTANNNTFMNTVVAIGGWAINEANKSNAQNAKFQQDAAELQKKKQAEQAAQQRAQNTTVSSNNTGSSGGGSSGNDDNSSPIPPDYDNQGTITVRSSTITITVWDWSAIDGDVVTLSLNGQVFASNLAVTGEKRVWTVNNLQKGKNWIGLIAINEGTQPPASPRIEIYDGYSTQGFSLLAYINKPGGYIIRF